MKSVYFSLLSTCAWIIECGDAGGAASTYALVDAPLLRGNKRMRRIDPLLKDVVAKAAGEGVLARSGSHALHIASRMRRWIVKTDKTKHGYTFLVGRIGRDLACVWPPDAGGQGNVVTLSMDATRMGKKDCLYVAVFLPETNIAHWCPPQASMGAI